MSDEIKVNSELPQKLATLGQVKDALDKRDEKIGKLTEDISNKITKFYASNQGETHLADSDSGKIMDMMLYGKSEQKQYSGKNLLELSDNQVQSENLKIQINQGIITFSGTANDDKFIREIDSFIVPSDGTYTISTNSNGNNDSPRILFLINDNPQYGSAFNGATKELNAGDVVRLYIRISSAGSYDGVTIKPMIEKGSKVTSYEPYTGGQSSPSPDYPQEIKSVVNPTVKLFGSNILKINDGKYQNNGVTITVSNGVIKAKGTFNSKSDFMLEGNLPMYFKEGTEIVFSPNNVNGTEKQDNCYIDFTNNNTVGFSIRSNNINTPYIIKERDAKYLFYLFLRFDKGTTLDETWKPQILIGKTITPFKPYKEQSITLPITLNAIPVSSSGNVTISGQQYVADYVDIERGKVVRMCRRETFNTKNGEINEEYRLALDIGALAKDDGSKECIFSAFKYTKWETCVVGTKLYIKNIKKSNNELYTAQELKELGLDFDVIYQLAEKQEIDLTTEQITAFKELVTYYPVTNVSVNSEQLDGYTIFNYPISMANGWNYVKQQLNDNRDYIYDMDVQSAEAYVNSEYAVALTELEV